MIDSAAWTVVAASDQKQLAVVVASAIEIAQPERIIFLGSGARGEMVEDGGLDLLVVAGAPTGEPWRAGTGRRGLRRSAALEITVATSAEVEANRHDPCCCIHDALREGRVLYHVADAPPLDTE